MQGVCDGGNIKQAILIPNPSNMAGWKQVKDTIDVALGGSS